MAPGAHLPFMVRTVLFRARWARLVSGLQLRTIRSYLLLGALYAQAFRTRFVFRRLHAGRARDGETALAEQAAGQVALQRMPGTCCAALRLMKLCCGCLAGFMVVAGDTIAHLYNL